MTVDGLLDTSILVDLLREQAACLNWMQTQASTQFALPVLVHMELIDGAGNAAERQSVQKALAVYPVIHLTTEDSIWAQQQHAVHKLSHNVGIIDALIAAPARRLQVPIYTLNVKHFKPLLGVKVIKPY
jgi:predicted nucleic acid-binding protein